MGRELKRVALDFHWPIGSVWHGYLNPWSRYSFECPACCGSGYTKEAQRLKELWYGSLYGVEFDPASTGSAAFTPEHPVIREQAVRNCDRAPEFFGSDDGNVQREAKRLCRHYNQSWSHHLDQDDVDALVEAGRLYDFTHTFVAGQGWIKNDDAPSPTAQQVNDWSLRGLAHDSINSCVVIRAKCKRMGVEEECAPCSGEGYLWMSAAAKRKAEAWERQEPPKGKGYQMWETTSEGSPISPVFESPQALAFWLAENEAETGTYHEWLKMIQSGSGAPSLVVIAGKVTSGVKGVFGVTKETGKI